MPILSVEYKYWIPGKVPSMNELIYAKQVTNPHQSSWLLDKKKNKKTHMWNKYNEIKKAWTKRVEMIASLQLPPTPLKSVYLSFHVIENTRKRDPDNFCFSAIKFINDGLVKAGVLENDGANNVTGIKTTWEFTPEVNPGIFVTVIDINGYDLEA
jgi:hypothetical protein